MGEPIKNRYEFVILFDVAEGEQKDFYQKLYNADKAQNSANAKWRGVFKQNIPIFKMWQ